MRAFKILYKTAEGVTKLTQEFICNSTTEAWNHTTDFVRANFVSFHEVTPSNVRQEFRYI